MDACAASCPAGVENSAEMDDERQQWLRLLVGSPAAARAPSESMSTIVAAAPLGTHVCGSPDDLLGILGSAVAVWNSSCRVA